MRAFVVPYIGTETGPVAVPSTLIWHFYIPRRRPDHWRDKSRPETKLLYTDSRPHKGRSFRNSIGAGGDYRRSEICKLSVNANESRKREINATR